MDEKVERVLGFFRQVLSADGGVLELVSIEDGVARVRYMPGRNDACPECVLTRESLQAMIAESMQVHAPHISRVELL